MIDWNKEFPLTSLTRADLVQAGFSEEQVSLLTDEDMRAIASKMEDLYCDHGFWDDLETAVHSILGKKEQ